MEAEIAATGQRKQLVEQEGMIWLKPYFGYEQGIAQGFAAAGGSQQAIRSIDAEKAADWVQGQLTIQFAEQQKEAVMQGADRQSAYHHGGPGTGKSTITNAILAVTGKLTERDFAGGADGARGKAADADHTEEGADDPRDVGDGF